MKTECEAKIMFAKTLSQMNLRYRNFPRTDSLAYIKCDL